MSEQCGKAAVPLGVLLSEPVPREDSVTAGVPSAMVPTSAWWTNWGQDWETDK